MGYQLPKSFIKNVAIQLHPKYELSNNPFEIKTKKSKNKKEINSLQNKFIGRKKNKSKFISFLNSSKKGVFLVTGYRGMGKTSFVNNVVGDFINKNETRKIIPIHLTIAQSNPKEFEVLRQIVNSIYDQFKNISSLKKTALTYIDPVRKFILISFIFFSFAKIVFEELVLCSYLSIFQILSVLFVFYLIITVIKSYLVHKNILFYKIEKLMDRCHSAVTDDRIKENTFGLFTGIASNGISSKLNHRINKQYPIADSKVIEYELVQFLNKAKNEHYEFIFIFDELDKIELNTENWNLNEDLESFENKNRNISPHNILRNRKQAVLGIIAGLKNFFTTADARFIFIAGREMFDASLADIADKQSPLSSMFTYVFHIESLLKERGKDNNVSSLSVALEDFLKYQLFDKEEIENVNGKKEKSLEELVYEHYISRKSYDEGMQIYFLLQGLITYLVYRSSGSPKKLIKTFQEFIVTDITSLGDFDHITFFERAEIKSKKYLHFNNSEQYRIGFINSIYRPYIVQFGRGYKTFSENTIISIPYFFDHLFKFHPFAFSMSNLELIPDLLATNKTPTLKKDLKQVIDYLYDGHIRDTDIELFDYKFYSKTTNEITYISKVFEDEAAAFNFTLDESYPAKSVLINKIKELRSIHSKFNLDPESYNPQIFSIANLNSNLGDLYFFDQEFDDAISSYSDSIRPINNIGIEKLNLRDFINLVRNKLKIGLCFEKINSFEEALAFYSDSGHDIKRYFDYCLNNSNYISFNHQTKRENEEKIFFTSSLNDLLQICVQAFLANLYIQEKMGLEGTNSSKAKVAFSDFYRIVEETSKHCGKNRMIMANSMLHYGKLLYYKNSSKLSVEDEDRYTNHYPLGYELKRDSFKKYFPNDSYEHSNRQPTLAFWLYLMGIDEVKRTRKCYLIHEFDSKSQKNDNGLLYDKEGKVNLLHVYLKDLTFLIRNSLEDNLNALTQNIESYTGQHLKYFASFLSSIGDCILGMNDVKNDDGTHCVAIKLLAHFITNIDDTNFTNININNERFSLNEVFKCYYLSAQYYEKYGRLTSAIFEYRKILQVLRMVIPINTSAVENNDLVNSLLNDIEVKIVQRVKELIRSSNNRSDRHMILKTQSVIDENNIANKKWHLEYSIANGSEMKELDLLYENIKLKLTCHSVKVDCLIKPTHTISSQHLRLLELDYYCRYLDLKIKKIIKPVPVQLDDSLQNELRQDLIDFFFSKNSILRILKIYETDYMFGPSYTAYTHYSIAKMLTSDIVKNKTIEKCINESSDGFKETFHKLLGGKSMVVFDPLYHYGMAKDFYTKAIQLHTVGKEYRNQIKEMIYLEDDFNDNAFHFGASIERYLMINGVFNSKIVEINRKLEELGSSYN